MIRFLPTVVEKGFYMTVEKNDKYSGVLPESPCTYSVKEIAAILGVSKKTAYKLCEQNLFVTKRIGRIIRINKDSFEDWMNAKPD